MEIAYTLDEGGEYQYFNSPLSDVEIQRAIAVAEVGEKDRPAIFKDDDGHCRFYPDGDTLPKFHSIVFPDGSRWDAYNTKWGMVDWNGDADISASRAHELFQVLRRKASWVPMELLCCGRCPDGGGLTLDA